MAVRPFPTAGKDRPPAHCRREPGAPGLRISSKKLGHFNAKTILGNPSCWLRSNCGTILVCFEKSSTSCSKNLHQPCLIVLFLGIQCFGTVHHRREGGTIHCLPPASHGDLDHGFSRSTVNTCRICCPLKYATAECSSLSLLDWDGEIPVPRTGVGSGDRAYYYRAPDLAVRPFPTAGKDRPPADGLGDAVAVAVIDNCQSRVGRYQTILKVVLVLRSGKLFSFQRTTPPKRSLDGAHSLCVFIGSPALSKARKGPATRPRNE